MQTEFDEDLLAYFTDVEQLRDMFTQMVAAPKLSKRIIVIHGVGGVGKSSLLRMFRLHCKSINVPVALASGDEAKSALDVLARWADDLRADGITLPTFIKTYEHYRVIQAKVDKQAKKTQDARGRMADIAGKAASKTAEAAGGALAGAAIGSVIPGIGTAIGGSLGGVLAGIGAEALVDWLRGFLTKPDIDLLLNPAKKLTDDSVADVANLADKRRMVLMLDTFDQMIAFEDWACNVAQKLHTNVLLVIAGRALPNWSRAWQGWMVNAQVEELKPMTEDDMRKLVRRYYATMRGGEPNPTQVEAIIRFARGLPMVVTSAVQLWVKYGIEDFQSVKAEIVANLVDRLMEGVPSALIPALDAAAVVRWFDQPILRAVTGLADVRDIYNELRRFSFVRTRAEGLALHDAVREIMDENLSVQDSERHCELHTRAAAYFEKRLEKATGEEAERMGLERLYHRISADEVSGMRLFRESARDYAALGFLNNYYLLVNDLSSYPLKYENSRLWREYYISDLIIAEFQPLETDELLLAISNNPNAEPRLQAYALQRLAKRLMNRYDDDRAIAMLEKSLSLTTVDRQLAVNYHDLGFAFLRKGELDKSLALFIKARDFYIQSHDNFGLATSLRVLADLYFHEGRPGEGLRMRKQAKQVADTLAADPLGFKLMFLIQAFALVYYGHLHEIELQHWEARQLDETLGWHLLYINKNLGYLLGMQGKYLQSDEFFELALNAAAELKGVSAESEVAVVRLFQGCTMLWRGHLAEAEKNLVESLRLKRAIHDWSGIPELCKRLGELAEIKSRMLPASEMSTELGNAAVHYQECLELRWTERLFYKSAALTGLVRVKHAEGDYAAIPPLLTEAEQLAQQYEYNDHLASLRLTQAMTADKIGLNGENTALDRFKQAMVCALRYNRFLLDEVLSGRPQGTPLRPIIPYCLERGEEGRQMLMALRDWWKASINDIGSPRPDSISPIPEGIALLEAERIAREHEPGDGSKQMSVIEQIETAL